MHQEPTNKADKPGNAPKDDRPAPTKDIVNLTSRSTAGLDFCRFLADHALVTREQADSLRKQAMSAQVPLGRILLQQHIMDVRQVMQVLYLQADEPDVRFGELAIRLGFLTREQLQRALREQRIQAQHPAEVLRDRGILMADELLDALITYVKRMEADRIAAS